ncbi:uncharacterized protein LOC123551062 [Mercenaria mercenaria]|uniref:uncharacterized protein LOC123551062 n=1 Tax=Mercenaria mercenaria TaxID=6596 RepID=UPI00234F9EC4|nr:uncharacterized protein LOC123551062 [Mercenaria mercenaria]
MDAHFIVLTLLLYSVWQFTEGETAESFGNTTDITNCTMVPRNTDITGELKELIDDGNRKITLNIEITGELGPLGEQYPGGLFEPKKWILITEEAGKSLLLFPDDHVAKSLYTLSFGLSSLEITLDQQPENCLNRNYTLDQILNTIRFYVLRNFTNDVSNVPDNFEVCNREVSFENDNTTGELQYICCNDVIEACYILKPGIWLNILDTCKLIIEFMVPFLCPLFIPKRIFKTVSIFRYSPNQCNGRSLRLLVKKNGSSQNPQGYTQINPNCLPKFETFMGSQVQGIHNLEVKSINFEARQDKLIEEESHPFGFWNFLFNTFIECEMRKVDDGLKECCNQNILKPFKCYISWIQFLKCITYVLLFAVLVSPWWFTVVFYYSYDYHFLEAVKSAGNALHVEISPTQTDFTSDYVMISSAFLFFILYNGTNDLFRLAIKTLFYFCIYGNSPFSESVSLFVTMLLLPLKTFGLFCGCFAFAFWVTFVVPFLLLFFILQTLPLVSVFNNLILLYKEFQELRKEVQINVWTCLFTFVACIQVIYISVFVVSDCVILFIDCFVYSMTGLLLNYDDVFKYVFLILLFFLYGYDCFNNVHKRYSYFSKLLNMKMQAKVINQFKDFGRQDNESAYPSNGPINTAHVVPSSSNQQPNEICFTYVPQDCLYIKAKRLVVFFDRSEAIPTPYISKQFFQEVNSIPSVVCPGSEYILYLKALRDFFFVVLFLLFVIIVVFALGRAHDLSSGVQTIVALGGGFLPFVFEKFFSKSHIRNMSEAEISLWGKLLEDRIDIFEERWKVQDIEVQTICEPRTVEESSVETDILCRPSGSIQVEISDTQEYDFVVSEETTQTGKILKIFVPNTSLSVDTETEVVVYSKARYQSLA